MIHVTFPQIGNFEEAYIDILGGEANWKKSARLSLLELSSDNQEKFANLVTYFKAEHGDWNVCQAWAYKSLNSEKTPVIRITLEAVQDGTGSICTFPEVELTDSDCIELYDSLFENN
jgi:hypothetical protein